MDRGRVYAALQSGPLHRPPSTDGKSPAWTGRSLWRGRRQVRHTLQQVRGNQDFPAPAGLVPRGLRPLITGGCWPMRRSEWLSEKASASSRVRQSGSFCGLRAIPIALSGSFLTSWATYPFSKGFRKTGGQPTGAVHFPKSPISESDGLGYMLPSGQLPNRWETLNWRLSNSPLHTFDVVNNVSVLVQCLHVGRLEVASVVGAQELSVNSVRKVSCSSKLTSKA